MTDIGTKESVEARARELLAAQRMPLQSYSATEPLYPESVALRAITAALNQGQSVEGLRKALKRIAKLADEPRKDWSRTVGDIAREALSAISPTPAAEGDDIGVVEAARDLLERRDADERTVGYRADLWNCLRAALQSTRPTEPSRGGDAVRTAEANDIADELDKLSSSHRPLLSAASRVIRALASQAPRP